MVEAMLAERFPEVELIDLEVRGDAAATLTLFIDSPGGVDLDLCAAVSESLEGIRERYALEVSSPGLDRRLRKPAHFAAALGRDVAIMLTAPQDGRRNFRGELTAAGESSVTLVLAEGGEVTLPIAAVARAHVVHNFDSDGGRRE